MANILTSAILTFLTNIEFYSSKLYVLNKYRKVCSDVRCNNYDIFVEHTKTRIKDSTVFEISHRK